MSEPKHINGGDVFNGDLGKAIRRVAVREILRGTYRYGTDEELREAAVREEIRQNEKNARFGEHYGSVPRPVDVTAIRLSPKPLGLRIAGSLCPPDAYMTVYDLHTGPVTFTQKEGDEP